MNGWLWLVTVGTLASTAAIKLDQIAPPLQTEQLLDRASELLGKVSEESEKSLIKAASAILAVDEVQRDDLRADLCLTARRKLESPAELRQTTAAALIAGKLGCLEKAAALKVQSDLWAIHAQAPSIEGYASALQACHTLAKIAKYSAQDREKMVLSQLLVDTVAPSGRVRSKGGVPVSMGATGLAYQVVKSIRALDVSLSPEAEAAIATLLSNAREVLEQASEKGLMAAGDFDGLTTAAYFLEGLASLGSDEISTTHVSRLASFLSRFSTVGAAQDAALLLRARKALQALGVPLLWFDVDKSTVSKDGKEEVDLFLKDLSGNTVSASDLTVELFSSSGGKRGNALRVVGTNGHYKFDLLQHTQQPGMHILHLAATSDGVDVKGRVTVGVTSAHKFQGAQLSIQQEDGLEVEEKHLHYGKAAEAIPLQVGPTHAVEVSLKDFEGPHAPTLRILCPKSGEALLVAFKRGGDRLSARASVKAIQSQLDSKCSNLLLVASPGGDVTNYNEWELASITIKGTAHVAVHSEPHALFQPKPIIRHQFRAPDRRPSEAISMLFAIAALAPLAALLLGLVQIQANIKAFPTSGAHFLPAAVFHAGLLGLVLLFAAFWLRLNLLQTLGPLAVLVVLLSISGYVLLSQLSALRLKQM